MGIFCGLWFYPPPEQVGQGVGGTPGRPGYAEDCSCPADLARKLGVSPARVTQVLRLLNLAPEVLKAIAALGDPLPSPIVTVRRLLPIVTSRRRSKNGRLRLFWGGKHLI
ncbi:MAG: hypothetical protein ACUVR2_12435 [Anaerolineae bacterium]